MRRLLFRIINHKIFEFFIICLILLSSVLIVIETPLENPANKTTEIYVVFIIDLIVSIIFLIEAIIKIIALGFLFNGPNSYLRNLANLLGTPKIYIIFRFDYCYHIFD